MKRGILDRTDEGVPEHRDLPIFDSEPFHSDWSEYPEPGNEKGQRDPKKSEDDGNPNQKYLRHRMAEHNDFLNPEIKRDMDVVHMPTGREGKVKNLKSHVADVEFKDDLNPQIRQVWLSDLMPKSEYKKEASLTNRKQQQAAFLRNELKKAKRRATDEETEYLLRLKKQFKKELNAKRDEVVRGLERERPGEMRELRSYFQVVGTNLDRELHEKGLDAIWASSIVDGDSMFESAMDLYWNRYVTEVTASSGGGYNPRHPAVLPAAVLRDTLNTLEQRAKQHKLSAEEESTLSLLLEEQEKRKLAPDEKNIVKTHGKEYPSGSIRIHRDGSKWEKQPDGKWKKLNEPKTKRAAAEEDNPFDDMTPAGGSEVGLDLEDADDDEEGGLEDHLKEVQDHIEEAEEALEDLAEDLGLEEHLGLDDEADEGMEAKEEPEGLSLEASLDALEAGFAREFGPASEPLEAHNGYGLRLGAVKEAASEIPDDLDGNLFEDDGETYTQAERTMGAIVSERLADSRKRLLADRSGIVVQAANSFRKSMKKLKGFHPESVSINKIQGSRVGYDGRMILGEVLFHVIMSSASHNRRGAVDLIMPVVDGKTQEIVAMVTPAGKRIPFTAEALGELIGRKERVHPSKGYPNIPPAWREEY